MNSENTSSVEFFKSFFETIKNDILDIFRECNFPQDSVEWVEKSLIHNCLGGKLNRGIAVVQSTEIMFNRPLTKEELIESCVLGWCIELLQAAFLVLDDVMDNGVTRRGLPCWYLMEKVGMIAINDGLMLQTSLFKIMKKYFRNKNYYADILDLFHEVTFYTEMGQLIDTGLVPAGEIDLSKFTMENYRRIAHFKTSFYSFYLPIAAAMISAGITSPDIHKIAKSICEDLGEYFQAQDDYLDVFSTPDVLGKTGTDIVDNKCSWLIVRALEICSPEVRQLLDDNYGRKDTDKEKKVQRIFYELKMDEEFKNYENEFIQNIEKKICENISEDGMAVSEGSPKMTRELFFSFLKKIVKRQK